MNIVKLHEEHTTTLSLSGRLDTTTAPQLEAAIDLVLPTGNELVLDLADLEYISSAGLRVLLKTHKLMSGSSRMTLVNVNTSVMQILEITAFTDFLNIR